MDADMDSSTSPLRQMMRSYLVLSILARKNGDVMSLIP